MTTTTNSATSATTETELRHAIKCMHIVSDGPLRRIRDTAWLALAAMEAKSATALHDELAAAFETIAFAADELGDCLRGRAEEHGCLTVDERAERRRRAQG